LSFIFLLNDHGNKSDTDRTPRFTHLYLEALLYFYLIPIAEQIPERIIYRGNCVGGFHCILPPIAQWYASSDPV